MAIMDVSVVLRLVDQLSGPAKKTADALRQIVDTTKQLKGAGGLDSIGKSLTSAVSATNRLRSEIRSLASDMQRLTGLSRGVMVGGRNTSWANQQVAAWRQVVQVQQQVIANQRRIAMGGGGFGGGRGGHGNPLYPMVPYHPLQHGLAEIGRAGADYNRQLTIGRMNSRTAEEIAAIRKRAAEVSRIVPMTSQAEIFKQINEMVPAFGDVKHALEFSPYFARSDALVATMLGRRQDSQSLYMARALEGVGAMKDHDRAIRLVDMWTQAIIGSGGKMTPENLSLAATYMRGSRFGANDEFMGRVLPSLIQQSQRPSTVGQELMSLSAYIVGQRFPKDIIPEWIQAGLIDESKLRKDKFGASKKSLMPGAVVGSDKYLRNPFEWVQKFVVPILEKEGILNDPEAVAKRISQLFPLRTAADIVTEMVTLAGQIRRDIDLYRKVQPPEKAIQTAVSGDWKSAVMDFVAAFNDLAKAFTEPLVEPAIAAMASVANTMRAITKSLEGVSPAVMQTVAVGGGLAGLVAVLRSPLLRTLLGGGIGFMAAGPMGALVGGGLASALTQVGTAATSATASLSGLGGGLSSLLVWLTRLSVPVAALAGAIGMKQATEEVAGMTSSQRWRHWGNDPWIKRLERANAGREQLGLPKIGEVPFLNSNLFQPFNTGVQQGVAPWQQGFLGTVGSFDGPWEQKGAQAGSSWGQAFVNAVRGALSAIGAIQVPMPSLPRPNIAPQPQSAPGGGGGSSETRSASISIIQNIHGSSDPKRTAETVYAQLAESLDRALADGAYAGSLA